MSSNITDVNEQKVMDQLGEFSRSIVKQTLNAMLDTEADAL